MLSIFLENWYFNFYWYKLKSWPNVNADGDGDFRPLKSLQMKCQGVAKIIKHQPLGTMLNLMMIWPVVFKLSFLGPKCSTERPTSLSMAKNKVAFQARLAAEFGCVCLHIGQLNLWTVLSEQFVSGRISKVGQWDEGRP